ncbi:aldehyde dehydrogenase family protein [Microbacterium suwonense]|uniref:Aldehyde dehydrogenase n=1 Tax=Microbacterium suwonense TaxID=683047 RepID=A0ABM8FUG1_9MICO|nr:aldehyde dehydrogenase family protein [Microbacterium suwonense]BDZ39323.1 aldehyde dehydrogenase [Microbacterium suwonense]
MSNEALAVSTEAHGIHVASPRHLIDGELREGEGSCEIISPWSGELLAITPSATVAEAREAASAAARAFHEGPWPRMLPAERSKILHDLAARLQARREDLVQIAIHQAGAVRSWAQSVQTDAPLKSAFDYAHIAGTFDEIESHSVTGPPLSGQDGAHVVRMVQRVPVGAVAGITPFNYPFRMAVQKIFPALAVGATMVLKPHPGTSLDAALIAEEAAASGLPAGVLNILLGGGADVGDALSTDANIDMVSFTGSTTVGKKVMQSASHTVKNISLELGGKSANIVFADADLDAFIATDPGNLKHAGQGCGQLTRLLVERPIYNRIVETIAAQMAQIADGEPDDETTGVGPVVNETQYRRILDYIEIGKQEGARLVAGGGAPEGYSAGYRIRPTLFADVRNDMRIAQEEIFGPVLVVIPFDGEDEAAAIANDSIYGINASVWSGDDKKAWRVASRLRTGNVGVNCLANVTAGPHGGFKQTGIGREWGKYSLDEYVELKAFETR